MTPQDARTTDEAQRGTSGRAAHATRAAAVRPGARVRPEHARRHNRALVLQALYRAEGLSRADLAREVGLTRVTISDLVADLIGEHLVIELGLRPDSRPGKPATLLDINRKGFVIVGLDLSNNAVFRGVVTDLDGTVIERGEVDVAGVVGDAATSAVYTLLDDLLSRAASPVIGIGVGSPGIVDLEGTVVSAPNLEWHQVPLQQLIAERYQLPAQVANDANMAAIGERTFGGADADMMLIRVGRGLGAGIVVGGQLIYGSGFASGEIGHVVVGTDGGDECACGKRGCLETWLATPRLEARLAGAENDAEREDILRAAGERLGISLGPVVGALNLSEVVLAGPHSVLGGALLEGTAETLRSRTMAELHGHLTLRMTTLGRDIVVLGAVVMVLTGQLGVS
ncbi:ROK family protein [Demequina muriae]|uniref:ROK family transcriptional regulator n=1 Tax=Demequina muriae TaxID=3051664 RepID=A0ABT8GHT6_9MICO|nr:ROK family transcriptional regulator [Demequina sp. EGI L300058]MDN4480939.1 ROK family transcriptional regulator [Demequina sp. EGI L300058]